MTIEQLKALGYSIKADKYGYQVRLDDKFVYGAGVAGKPKMHWQHARKNIEQNTETAWYLARKHYERTLDIT